MHGSRDDAVLARLSAQRAFLGEIRNEFRAITIFLEDKAVEVLVYVDGEMAEEYKEMSSILEAEMTADFDIDYSVRVNFVRLDFPETISDFGLWVFQRYEN